MKIIHDSDFLNCDDVKVVMIGASSEPWGMAKQVYDEYSLSIKRRKLGSIYIKHKVCTIVGQRYQGAPNDSDDTIDDRLRWFRRALEKIKKKHRASPLCFAVHEYLGGNKLMWNFYLRELEKFEAEAEAEVNIITSRPVRYDSCGLDAYVKRWRPRGWSEFFKQNKEIIIKISTELIDENKTHEIYPPMHDIFTAFELVNPAEIKVLILGQDPYHGPGQAHGLAFSVNAGIRPPPSLQNIYKELIDDGFDVDKSSGDLRHWASSGVFLLNTALTVRKGQAASHAKLWRPFTQALIKYLNDLPTFVAILWGAHAQGYEQYLLRHQIIKSAHPSPFSARNGFFGSKPFSRANKALKKIKKEPVEW